MDVRFEQKIGESPLGVPLEEIKVDSISNVSDCSEKKNEDATSVKSDKKDLEFNIIDRTSEDVDRDETSKLSDLDEKLLCSKNHKLNGLYPGYYYNCYECKRYFMNHSKYRCFTCANSFCLECKGNEKDQESGWFGKCTKNKIIRCILTSCLVDFIRRLVPMFQAAWVQVDVLLDLRQTWTYYKYTDDNGSYVGWAKDFMEKTNSTYEHSVSHGYYISAMVVWYLTPVLFALFLWISEGRPLSILNNAFDEKFDFVSSDNNFLKAFLGVLLFPIDIISAAVVIYFVIPFVSFKMAYKIMRRKEFEDTDKVIDFGDLDMDPLWIPGWKAFEFLGEACPQLILSVVFMANNYDFMNETDTFLNVKEFHVTLTSMIFSLGSISMGLYSGIPVLQEIYG